MLSALFEKFRSPNKVYAPLDLPKDIAAHFCIDELPQDLHPVIQDKLNFLARFKNKPSLPQKFDAVLVIDMQKEFCKTGPVREAIFATRRGTIDTEETVKHTAPIIDKFRDANLPIYSIYFAEKPKHPFFIDFYGYKYRTGDTLVYKNENSAFKTPDNKFEQTLNDAGHKNLLIVGFNTCACVKSTVIDAQKAGFNTWLALDCTGNDNSGHDTYTQEELAGYRIQSLIAMKNGGTQVTTSAAVLRHIQSAL